MLIKILSNLFMAGVTIWVFYLVFYFRIFPRIINHYRKAKKAERKYARDIDRINEED